MSAKFNQALGLKTKFGAAGEDDLNFMLLHRRTLVAGWARWWASSTSSRFNISAQL